MNCFYLSFQTNNVLTPAGYNGVSRHLEPDLIVDVLFYSACGCKMPLSKQGPLQRQLFPL